MNINNHYLKRTLWISSIMLTALMAGCNSGSDSSDSSNSAPTVIATSPADDAKAVPLNHKVIVTFSEAVDGTTVDTQSFSVVKDADGVALSGDISVDAASRTASFKPIDGFTAGTDYTATLTTAIKTKAGSIALANNYVWTFTSGKEDDIDAPTVSSTTPIKDAPNVAPNRAVTANFSEALDPVTVNDNTFTLVDSNDDKVSGAVSYSNKAATFTPSSNLDAGKIYTATLTTAMKDPAGNTLAVSVDNEWSFTTGSVVAKGPKPVNLRTAGDFAILSKTAITDVPTSPITGNIGVSPASATFIGVTCPEMQLAGITIYAVDPGYTGAGNSDVSCFKGDADAKTKVDNAILDMGTAYKDAAGRTNPDATELNAGEIGGTTITPGLYKWSSSVLIKTSTVLTLAGGANDVWIFQIADNLKLDDFAQIKLLGGAQAKNVFWQVGGGSGVTLNTDTHFEGVVLAATGAALVKGAAVNGRLLAETAVTLDQNTVTEPAE